MTITDLSEGTITRFSCDPATNGYTPEYNWVVGGNGEQLDELYADSSLMHTDVDGNGQLLASFAYAHWYYALNDWLGTKRATVLEDGTPQRTYSSFPYGERRSQSGGGTDVSEIYFTGHPEDVYTTNDYFGARDYRYSMSRFNTPDWSGDPEAVPYANPANPQSLNLYTYALDNPLGNVDPDGHAAKDTTGLARYGGFLETPPLCTVSGSPMNCGFLNPDAVVTCPGPCLIWSGGSFYQYVGDGDAQGYLRFKDIATIHSWNGSFYTVPAWQAFLRARQDIQKRALARYILQNYRPSGFTLQRILGDLAFRATKGGNSDFDVAPELQNSLSGRTFRFETGGCLMCRDGTAPSPHYDHQMMHLDSYRGGYGFEDTFLHFWVDVVGGGLFYGDVPMPR